MKKKLLKIVTLSSLFFLGGLGLISVSAKAADPLTVVGTLYGPVKDLGELLIDKYFEAQLEALEDEAQKSALEGCNNMYEKFWSRAEAGTMDDATTERYAAYFDKHCISLWTSAK